MVDFDIARNLVAMEYRWLHEASYGASLMVSFAALGIMEVQ